MQPLHCIPQPQIPCNSWNPLLLNRWLQWWPEKILLSILSSISDLIIYSIIRIIIFILWMYIPSFCMGYRLVLSINKICVSHNHIPYFYRPTYSIPLPYTWITLSLELLIWPYIINKVFHERSLMNARQGWWEFIWLAIISINYNDDDGGDNVDIDAGYTIDTTHTYPFY